MRRRGPVADAHEELGAGRGGGEGMHGLFEVLRAPMLEVVLGGVEGELVGIDKKGRGKGEVEVEQAGGVEGGREADCAC